MLLILDLSFMVISYFFIHKYDFFSPIYSVYVVE